MLTIWLTLAKGNKEYEKEVLSTSCVSSFELRPRRMRNYYLAASRLVTTKRIGVK